MAAEARGWGGVRALGPIECWVSFFFTCRGINRWGRRVAGAAGACVSVAVDCDPPSEVDRRGPPRFERVMGKKNKTTSERRVYTSRKQASRRARLRPTLSHGIKRDFVYAQRRFECGTCGQLSEDALLAMGAMGIDEQAELPVNPTRPTVTSAWKCTCDTSRDTDLPH